VIARYVAEIKIIGPHLANTENGQSPYSVSAMRGLIIRDTPAISKQLGKILLLW